MNVIGRLAPSPTGAQHLGNARTYLVAWLHARCNEGVLLLRIEDLDTPRTKLGAESEVLEDLRWLGLSWDPDQSAAGFLRQSDRSQRYAQVLERLKSAELVYPCTCTRREIDESASAPHESYLDGTVYSGKCSGRSASDAKKLDSEGIKYAWRFRMSPEFMEWRDEIAGTQSLDAKEKLGDFVIARNYGPTAYQLAVVVDDHDSHVTHVVRGNDLIYSTYRQIALYHALNWKPPAWIHVPLVVGHDGRRLAKRHGDTRLSTYRSMGVSAESILGHLAQSLKLTSTNAPIRALEILDVVRQKSDWLSEIPTGNVQIKIA